MRKTRSTTALLDVRKMRSLVALLMFVCMAATTAVRSSDDDENVKLVAQCDDEFVRDFNISITEAVRKMVQPQERHSSARNFVPGFARLSSPSLAKSCSVIVHVSMRRNALCRCFPSSPCLNNSSRSMTL